MQNTISRKIIYLLGATGILLSVPLLFKWPWDTFDFMVTGTLIFVTGLMFILVTRSTINRNKRMIVGLIFFLAFLLIWAELAVGLFGSPFAGS